MKLNHFDICKAYTTVSNHLNNFIPCEKKKNCIITLVGQIIIIIILSPSKTNMELYRSKIPKSKYDFQITPTQNVPYFCAIVFKNNSEKQFLKLRINRRVLYSRLPLNLHIIAGVNETLSYYVENFFFKFSYYFICILSFIMIEFS